MRSVCGELGMSRQNYYARRRHRQRRQVDEELIVQLVREERQVQPQIGTRKLHHMLKEPLAQAGLRWGVTECLKCCARGIC